MSISNIKQYLEEYSALRPATREEIYSLENSSEVSLPIDFTEFHLQIGSGEGYIGEEYVIFWPISDISNFNLEYEVNKYAPGILLFGSNGGGEAFGFDLRDNLLPIVMIPFIGMDLDTAKRVANQFIGFIEHIGEGNAPI